jgi:hypothetical protein
MWFTNLDLQIRGERPPEDVGLNDVVIRMGVVDPEIGRGNQKHGVSFGKLP